MRAPLQILPSELYLPLYLPITISTETITIEANGINKARVDRFKVDYLNYYGPERNEFKNEVKGKVKVIFDYLGTVNRDWKLEYSWVDRDCYIRGWDKAKRNNNDPEIILEGGMTWKRKSFSRGYADRLFWEFVDQYGSEKLQHKISSEAKTTSNTEIFKQKPIAIAYWALDVVITTSNAQEILNLHGGGGNTGSFLDERILTTQQLTGVPAVKSTSTRHLFALKAAIRLLNGAKRLLNDDKKKEAIDKLTRIATEFELAHYREYP